MKEIVICKKTNKQSDLQFVVKVEVQSSFKRVNLTGTPKKFQPIVKMESDNNINLIGLEVVEVYCVSCEYEFPLPSKNMNISAGKTYYDMIEEEVFNEHFNTVEVYQ